MRRKLGKTGRTGGLLSVLLAAVLVLSVAGHEARAAKSSGSVPLATAARLGGDAERTRFVTDLSRSVGFSVYVLPDPFRVVIDMPEVSFRFPSGLGTEGRGLVSAYRYGLFAPGKSRIVLDATEPVLIQKSFVLKPQNNQPARLVVDLVRTDRSTFFKIHNLVDKAKTPPPKSPPPKTLEQIAELALRTIPLPKPKPQRTAVLGPGQRAAPAMRVKPKRVPKRRPRKRVIIIDPGHGGVDPGARGRKGTAEKHVVFRFSKVLRDRLKATGRYKVLMTRNGDTFVRLKDRVRFARRNKGDLFIAVHADSIRRNRNRVRGATVYTLSERASDKEAAALAARENKADLIAGVALPTESDEVAGILIDLAQRETNNLSVTFARSTIKSLRKVTRMTKKPHRTAGFRVLKAPDIPSILLELGYISSRQDERLLLSSKWRKKVANAMVRAVDGYFRDQQIAGR